MWSSLASLGGWSVVPDFASKHLLQFAYTTPFICRTLRLTPSAPNTAAYRQHYGITFALVVLGYLLYTLVDKAIHTPPNFYEILGVPYTVDDNGLKLAFRHFARRNHPDRPGVGKAGEELFMHVRDVFEALKDPAVRFAYDRFGPDVLRWKSRCSTPGDFLRHGLTNSAGYHIAGLAFLLFWSVLGRSTSFTFWRYTLYFTLLAAELALILSPSPSPSNRHITPLHYIFPNRVVYQHILFLHQIFMFLNVALFRVTPYLLPIDEFDDPRVEAALTERTIALVNVADRETSKMIHTELQSIAPATSPSPSPSPHDPGFGPLPQHPSFARMEPVTAQTAMALLTELAPEIEQLILETNLKRGDGPLKGAWEAAVRRAFERAVEEAVLRESEAREGREEAGTQTYVVDEAVSGPFSPPPLFLEESLEGGAPMSRDTTPTPATPGRSRMHIIKAEEEEPRFQTQPASPNGKAVAGSGYFMPSTPPSSRGLQKGVNRTPRSMIRSVPRTPGELPSPRPSPSPPPSPYVPLSSPGARRILQRSFAGQGAASPGVSFPVGNGRGAKLEDEEAELFLQQMVAERMRGRSVSC
ncbi:chaperone DNAJ [Ephemerocybe angulata]|uniref:Chaperone DNAJ n=1 Tax=Ephemerocybe angulata TaxID=980116 RepID=A0A8H6I9N8_9AGAR|nr:chaperone DNAJ [Tulosesus angulatus]